MNSTRPHCPTPAELAILRDDVGTLGALLDEGCSPNQISFTGHPLTLVAAKARSGRCFALLLRRGADLSARGAHRRSLAHLAAHSRCAQALRALVDLGAPCDERCDMEQTPAMVCAQNGFLEGLRELWRAGADLGALDPWGASCWEVATHEGHRDCAAFIRAQTERGELSASCSSSSPSPRDAWL